MEPPATGLTLSRCVVVVGVGVGALECGCCLLLCVVLMRVVLMRVVLMCVLLMCVVLMCVVLMRVVLMMWRERDVALVI